MFPFLFSLSQTTSETLTESVVQDVSAPFRPLCFTYFLGDVHWYFIDNKFSPVPHFCLEDFFADTHFLGVEREQVKLM